MVILNSKFNGDIPFLITLWTYVFSEISFFSLTYRFFGGGKAQCPKKIYRSRVILNIPAPPWIDDA